MSRLLKVAAVTMVVLAGLGLLLAAGVGKPISTDLSLVGKGRPALVLAYENYSPAGADAFERLSRVKGHFEARIEFLIADLGVPQGRTFAERHGLANGQALFLAPDGQALATVPIPADETTLRSLLEDQLASLP